MPIQIHAETKGKVVDIHLHGKMVKEDYASFTVEFDRLLKLHGKLHVLFDVTGLEGWDAGAAWEDLKFDIHHYSAIERMAMVGDEKWQHVMATLFKPFMKGTLRYFDHADMAAAKKWLLEA